MKKGICKTSRQVSGLYLLSFVKYSEKCFTQTYLNTPCWCTSEGPTFLPFIFVLRTSLSSWILKRLKKNPFALTCFQCHLCNVFLFFIVFSLPHMIRMLREKTLQIWTVHRRKFRCDKPRVVFTEISTINLICFCYLQKAETEKQVKTIVQNILLLLLQKASHAEAEDDLRSIINFCR